MSERLHIGASTLGDSRLFEAGREVTVGTSRCLAYNLNRVQSAVRRCVAALPDMQERFREARKVLLKPNLLSSSRGPEAHVNTHPAVVQAIAEHLINDFGCEVAIGDSCGTVAEGSTAKAIQLSGMDAVAEKVGATIYNVDAQPRHEVAFPEGEVFKRIPLPANLDQFDLIVSVAKLKTHGLTYVTGPVKNLFGLVPGAEKKHAHLMAPQPQKFAALICDLYQMIRPGAAFIDGVMAMEGAGPANGALRHVEMIAASCDPVALDAFGAQVMGFDPMTVPLLAKCQERGLGTADPAGFLVRGEPASAFAPGDFAKPSAYSRPLLPRLIPSWLFRGAFDAMATRHAVIDPETCIRCGQCEENCPSHAISQGEESGPFVVDPKKCIACYCCTEVCPVDAVAMKSTRLKRFLDRVSSPFR